MIRLSSFNAVAAAAVLAFATAAIPPSASAQGETTPKPRHTADEIAKAKPSATFELDAEQIRLLVGGATGKGTLQYQGKSYPFTIKAATAGGVGVTKVHATGTVYFLDKLEDFAGRYSAVTIGAALGPGMGGSQYENQKGVFLSVRSKTEGVGLNLGLGLVEVSFVK